MGLVQQIKQRTVNWLLDNSNVKLQNTSVRSNEVNLSQLQSWGDWLGDLSNSNSAGMTVNSTTALSFSAVYAAIKAISETVAILPLERKRIYKDGKKEVSNVSVTDELFLTHPNPFQTWFDFKFHLVKEALCNGNGYAKIERDNFGRAIALQPLSSFECQPYYLRDSSNHFLYYYIHGEQTVKEDVIHIKCLGSNGVVGYSPITIARDAIGAGLAQQTYTGSLYKNGLNVQGVMEHPSTLSDAAQNRLKNQMDKYKGASNSNSTLVLEEGLTYKTISINPKDADFIASRRFTVEEIARMYRVPLHKLGELSRSTNNNIEHQSLEFYSDTISPWLERIEQEFDMKLCFGQDKKSIKHEFDARRLLRTDSKSRAEYYKALFNMGAKTPNEIRVAEGDNAINDPKMNKTYIQMNMSAIEDLNDEDTE